MNNETMLSILMTYWKQPVIESDSIQEYLQGDYEPARMAMITNFQVGITWDEDLHMVDGEVDFDKITIPLRTVSQMTDAELIDMCKIFNYHQDNCSVHNGKYLCSMVFGECDNLIGFTVMDFVNLREYLISIGVIVPMCRMTVEEIIDSGFVTIKTI